ncbi:SH3 domain-containing protein [uncultured Anaerococcus sp.]|uniref:aggregation-promoting factor C-terminal-like domain-containing protein n=1 Tax=uncultured Anaerococcus sp. TaxID=293428 RepID=UPI00261B8304|nr:SH3 domain-containing protein [uncultured Anaerococcus sp.]
MNKFTKYALAAALVLPSMISLGAKQAKADSVVINKEVAHAVNVRSSAAEKNNIIGLINDDSRAYEILGRVDGWYKIDFNGREAFVGTPWFKVTKDTEVISPANFRKEANLGSEIFKVLDKGTKVEILGEGANGFIKVKFEGKEGYVYNNLLKAYKNKKQEAKPKAKQEAQATTNKAQVANNQQTYDYVEETTYYEQPQETYEEEQSQSYQGDSNWAKEWIAQRESGGSYTAYNPAGGYYGKYQLNPSLVSYGASPAEQEAAADAYVSQRYGSWENAQAFWANNGWY